MADEIKNPLVLKEPTSDFTDKDMEKINAFNEAGLPGVGSITDSQFVKMMQLYMDGKTYTQISSIMRLKKDLVLFHAYKWKWFEAKKEILLETEQSLRNRIVDAHITGQDFILQLKQTLEKKINHNIFKYLETEDENYINKINLKEIDRYLKLLETLKEYTTEPRKQNSPTSPIGINLGEGMTVKKLSDGGVEITPKAKTMGDVLKQYADLKRQEEKNLHDISKDESKKQGESGNEQE